MLFLMVVLTFAACLFGVVAIEVSVRRREEEDRSRKLAAQCPGSIATADGTAQRRIAPAAPASEAGTSRAA